MKEDFTKLSQNTELLATALTIIGHTVIGKDTSSAPIPGPVQPVHETLGHPLLGTCSHNL